MTPLVARDDLESRADCESNSRDKRNPKPNSVYILAARSDEEFAASSVVGQESVENADVDVRRRSDFGWSGGMLAVRRGLNKAADKPASQPPGSDLLRRRIRHPFERGVNRR